MLIVVARDYDLARVRVLAHEIEWYREFIRLYVNRHIGAIFVSYAFAFLKYV